MEKLHGEWRRLHAVVTIGYDTMTPDKSALGVMQIIGGEVKVAIKEIMI